MSVNRPAYPERLGASGAAAETGLRRHMIGVYDYMAAGVVVSGTVAFAAASSGFYQAIAGTPFVWLLLVIPVVLAFVFGSRLSDISTGVAQAIFWTYAALMGLSLGGIFLIYTDTRIALSFFVVAAMFGAMSLWGYTTRADLDRFSAFLIMGLIGIIVASIVNIFTASAGLESTISIVAVVVFTGMTAWDTQAIKGMYYAAAPQDRPGRTTLVSALMLYLDFINLFLNMLRLLGARRRN